MRVEVGRAARGAARLASGDRIGIVLRLIFPIALIEIALWAPFRFGLVFGLGAVSYITWQLWKVTTDSRSLGFDWRGLVRETWLLGATFALASLMLITAFLSGSLHRLWGLEHPWYAVAGYTCWAFLQEFMLQCFCVRMLRALVSRVSSLLLSGLVFSMAHLPNLNLTLITFFAGVAFTFIYVRKRNLYVVAVIHTVLGLALAVSTPEAWFHGLRVGREFLRASAIAAPVATNR